MPQEFNSGSFRPMTGKNSTLRTKEINDSFFDKKSPSRVEVFNIDTTRSDRRMLDFSKQKTMDFKSVASGGGIDQTTLRRHDSNSPSGLGLNTLLSQ